MNIENESEFINPPSVSMKLWYLKHISDIIDDANKQGKEFYIWGTGKYGLVVKDMVRVFLPQISVSGFTDSL